MNCTRCGKPSRVTETRHPDSSPRTWVGEIREASRAVSWFTYDFIMRRRVCPDGHAWFTVECNVNDTKVMIEEGRG